MQLRRSAASEFHYTSCGQAPPALPAVGIWHMPDTLAQFVSLSAAMSSWLAAVIRTKSVNDLTNPCNPTCLRMAMQQASTVAQISVADSVASYDVELLTGAQAEQVCSRELSSKPELPSPPGATQYAPPAVMHQRCTKHPGEWHRSIMHWCLLSFSDVLSTSMNGIAAHALLCVHMGRDHCKVILSRASP